VFDLVEEPSSEVYHTRKFDFGDAFGCVTLVPIDSLVLVVVPENGASVIRIAIVERIAVATGVLWVIGLDYLPIDNTVVNTVFNGFDDRMTH